jgi:hypothetical protein
MSIDEFVLSGSDYISPTVALRDVRYVYEQDEFGNRTNKIVAVRYMCIDPTNFSSYAIKVMGSEAIITPEQIKKSPDIILIDIPVDDVIIRPYELSFGQMSVSISAPFVSIHSGSARIEDL